MSKNGRQTLFALVESFFADFLPHQRGASLHTVRAYRDSLKLLLQFIAQQRKCEMAKLQLSDLTADVIADFLDHIEADRSNAAATRNSRRAALRSFIKHLLRNDLAHSLQYTQILAIPSPAEARNLSRTGRCPRYYRQAGPRDARRVARLHFTLVPLQLRRSGQRSDRCSVERPPSDRTPPSSAPR